MSGSVLQNMRLGMLIDVIALSHTILIGMVLLVFLKDYPKVLDKRRVIS